MKAEMYRSKKNFPGQVIMAGQLDSGLWYIEGVDGETFDSIEAIEKYLDDELEHIVVKQ